MPSVLWCCWLGNCYFQYQPNACSIGRYRYNLFPLHLCNFLVLAHWSSCLVDLHPPRPLPGLCSWTPLYYNLTPYASENQATGYASQHFWWLSQARINCEGCVRKGILRKNGGDGGHGAPISLDRVAVHADCWCICLCYLHFAPENPEDGEMYLLMPTHLVCPRQGPESRRMVVCVCVCVCVCLYVQVRSSKESKSHCILETFLLHFISLFCWRLCCS